MCAKNSVSVLQIVWVWGMQYVFAGRGVVMEKVPPYTVQPVIGIHAFSYIITIYLICTMRTGYIRKTEHAQNSEQSTITVLGCKLGYIVMHIA